MANELEEQGRVAVVTGGSRGIGREVVRRLAAKGYSIAVNYAGNTAEAEAAVREASAAGAKATAVQADVADEVAVAAMFEEAESLFGGVDVVVHSAGRILLAPVADTDLDELDALHRTNVRGTFVVAQQAARRLRRGGSLVLLSSTAVNVSFPTYGAYAASKGAVEAMTMILAREMRGREVTVNAVSPGPTATDMILDGTRSEAQLAELAAASPLERLGEPTDIAEVAAFLASPRGRWINGQVIRANGGMA